ncbi:hypothetical protein A3C89_02980 [Candidatus Kaiserbacteria bacterium RIFCSPHIGHO2_02_FULL_50_50]|uniref:DUF4231 domain-containing protein n=1 Tax=Candidatus Kaiserbacteria bacterium RIFCSPHIGHO2_02_FULL_50_50 TaxID=1798492 RepID=A0A1F6DCY0_9BACT|nr:MAG: hypothetical protein A3C89_02980 [Candidatus Kaiserbacteria bacterium RIFCSPHIGHO2_02_FULL_50_50]OGG88650.1 MAG: hypothetical protein A3G62_00965 [Candidatus Kaiserbacteria bacterium RIFCSPLOWO2_12_FULL_50_10]
MKTPGAVESEPTSGYERLEQQIKWYDSKAGHMQKMFKRSKVLEIALSAFIPVTAFSFPTITAVLGACVIILEGLQHINKWGDKWNSYRSNCESLRHEKYSYIGRFADYTDLDDKEALKLLGERTELFVSTEHTKWRELQSHALKEKSKAS